MLGGDNLIEKEGQCLSSICRDWTLLRPLLWYSSGDGIRKEPEVSRVHLWWLSWKCHSQIACCGDSNWQMVPHAMLWICYCVYSEATLPTVAPSQRQSIVVILMQAHSCETCDMMAVLTHRLLISQGETFLELHCSLRLYLPNLSSFPPSFRGIRPASLSVSNCQPFWYYRKY